MRQRIIATVAVVVFAAAIGGVAVWGTGRGRSLPRLPLARGAAASVSEGAMSAASSMAPFGPVEYRLAGALPKLADHAPAFHLGQEDAQARVGRLVTALGLKAAVERTGDGWRVEEGPRVLTVQAQPGLPWSMFDRTPCVSGGGGKTQPAEPVPAAGGTPSAAGGGASAGVGGVGVASSGAASAAGRGGGAIASSGGSVAGASSGGAVAGASSGGAVAVSGCAVAVPGVVAAQPPPSSIVCEGPGGVPCAPGVACPQLCRQPTGPFPAPAPPSRPADLPTREQAEAQARSILQRVGPSIEGARVEVFDSFTFWSVQVEPAIAGLPTYGFVETVGIGSQGKLLHGSGYLAVPSRIGDYPLAGLDQGLDRLRHGVGIGPQPLMGASSRGLAAPTPGNPVACPRPPVNGGPPSPGAPGGSAGPSGPAAPAIYPYCGGQPVVRTITGAHVALELVPSFEPTQLSTLEPVYVFELEGAQTTQPVPAVTEDHLQATSATSTSTYAPKLSPQPAPVPPPATQPTNGTTEQPTTVPRG